MIQEREHPTIRKVSDLVSQEAAIAMGPLEYQRLVAERERRLDLEIADPFHYGYEAAIWHQVDNLLCDGVDVKICVPDAKGIMVPGPIMKGAPEILVTGWNRSGKSEYAGKKCMKVLVSTADGRGWSFADTGPISIARQQPIFDKYMPTEVKRLMRGTGKARQGAITNITYTKKGGFTEQTFVLPNGAQHWFKNYAQDVENLEGDQLDVAWFDELRNPELLRTIRFRMGDRGGIVIVTFTPIDENYTAVVNEYERGARTMMEIDGELLPIYDEGGQPTGKFEQVPRVKVAGIGTDGTQRANIVYFHISDNPFYAFQRNPKPGAVQHTGKEVFRRLFAKASPAVIRARAYGILGTGGGRLFKFNASIHVIPFADIPRKGTNYLIADPCPGRNWFMAWCRVVPIGGGLVRRIFYREWPSFGHPGAYIPGVGPVGAWALPGKALDGERGPAQKPFGWGLNRYKEEILRLEGHEPTEEERPEPPPPPPAPIAGLPGDKVKPAGASPFKKALPSKITKMPSPKAEVIAERRMDSRYGAAPTQRREGNTTILEEMEAIGMEFLATSGADIGDGIELIKNALDYDLDVKPGAYSPMLARANVPLLQVADTCPNLIYALTEYTGKDGQKGATKDPIDVVRYAEMDQLDYLDETAWRWIGGGVG